MNAHMHACAVLHQDLHLCNGKTLKRFVFIDVYVRGRASLHLFIRSKSREAHFAGALTKSRDKSVVSRLAENGNASPLSFFIRLRMF